jgi:hypothetical protein
LRDTTSQFQIEFMAAEQALRKLISTTPSPIRSAEKVAIADLSMLQTISRGNFIRLHGPFTLADEESKRKVLVVAKEIVGIAHTLEREQVEEIWWQVPINVWVDFIPSYMRGNVNDQTHADRME